MTRVAFVIAIFCTLAGVIFYSYDSFQKKEHEVAKLQNALEPGYLVAKRDLLCGTIIRDSDLTSTGARIKVPEGALEDTQKARVVGRKTKFGLSSGQLILESQLTAW